MGISNIFVENKPEHERVSIQVTNDGGELHVALELTYEEANELQVALMQELPSWWFDEQLGDDERSE